MSRAGISSRRGTAVALAAVVLLAGCTSEPSEPPEAEAERQPELVLADGQQQHRIGITFQSGPFLVTVGEAVYDRQQERLYLGVRLTNQSDEWQPAAPEALLRLAGQERSVHFGPGARIPTGHATDLTGEVSISGGDPLAEGTLVWGRADQNRTEISIADATVLAGGWQPVEIPVDAWGQIGRHTVHVYAGRLYADALHAARAPAGQRVLRLFLDEYTSQTSPVNGFFPADHFQLVWPDGTTVEPLRGSMGRGPQSWTWHTGHWVDLPVPGHSAGDYQLLLASVSRHAFGLPHPELIDRVAIPVTIPPLAAEDGDVPAGPLPLPRLPRPDGAADATPVELALESGEVNVPGFGFTPTRLRWDPTTATATLTGTARLLPVVDPPDPDDIFTTPSHFSFTTALVSAGRAFGGVTVDIDLVVEPDRPREVSYEFRFVDALHPDDVTLLIGPNSMPASVVPLTSGSPYALEPTTPMERPIDAPPVTAGDYTVQLLSYRFGLPGTLDVPPVGKRALEITYDVTVSPHAQTGITGLGFRSRAQLFIAHPHGYLQQAEQHSGDIPGLEPGQTARTSATYYVPVTWQPDRLGFAVRSLDENTAVGGDRWWVEVTFAAVLRAGEAAPDDF
jgi:hypothetical protein